jgi:hypothetical protein
MRIINRALVYMSAFPEKKDTDRERQEKKKIG